MPQAGGRERPLTESGDEISLLHEIEPSGHVNDAGQQLRASALVAEPAPSQWERELARGASTGRQLGRNAAEPAAPHLPA